MQMTLFTKPKEPTTPVQEVVQTKCPFECPIEAPIKLLRDESAFGHTWLHCLCEGCHKRFTREIWAKKEIDRYLTSDFKPLIKI